jgi:hypothetical protein
LKLAALIVRQSSEPERHGDTEGVQPERDDKGGQLQRGSGDHPRKPSLLERALKSAITPTFRRCGL